MKNTTQKTTKIQSGGSGPAPKVLKSSKKPISNAPLAVITGATSGIGKAVAEKLRHLGWDLLLVGRRKERLERMQKDLGAQNVLVHSLDVSSASECEEFFRKFQDDLARANVLVNSAGLAKGTEKLQDSLEEDWDEMIDTNIKGLLRMIRGVVPYMIKSGQGDIVNLGSVAGRWTYPGGSVYCASKFAVRAISESLRMDLLGTKVRVINIEPGMVETEFSVVRLGDEEKAKKVYENMAPLTAEDIAESIIWSLQRPRHVNIQELVIFPTDQAAVGQVHRSPGKS